MQHLLSSNSLTVGIHSAGAEIHSVKNKAGLEFMWQAKPDVWPRHAPVLFPVVGKLKDNAFRFDGTTYPLTQHGFARDREFKLVSGTSTACVFELRSDAASRKVYPFDFIFQIHYLLEGNTLITRYKIVNPSNRALFFSVGAHPGFKCPLLPHERFDDYYLEFESASFRTTRLHEGLRKADTQSLPLTDARLPLSARLFDNDALVFENSQIHEIHLCSRLSAHKISMTCTGWPYFGIWSKKGCTEFVCLEPWYGIADREDATGDLVRKDGIVEVAPGEEFACHFSVTFA